MRLPLMLKAAAFACLGLAVWVTLDLAHWWELKPDYSFGYLVPIFCGYVLYDRWPRIQALFDTTDPHPVAAPRSTRWMDWFGAAALFWCCICFAIGALYRAYTGITLPGSFVMTVSFSGIILSTAMLFSDKRSDGSLLTVRERWEFVGIVLFPALVWIISAPLMSAIETKVSLFLLNKVTVVVFGIYDMLGLVIERRANVIVLPKGEVGVEEACSGIRSLTGCLFAGSFLSAVFLDRLWKKVLLVGVALILAFMTNIARGLFLTGWAYAYGSDSIEGTVHDVTGYAVLGVTVVLLLCLIPLFNYKLPQMPQPIKAEDKKPDNNQDDGVVKP